MRYIIGICLLLAACSQPQPMEVNLIPKPQSLEVQEGMFVLNHSTASEVDELFHKELSYFKSLTGLPLQGEKNKLIFRHQEGLAEEEFYLNITTDSLQITASTAQGIMRGIQTLRQLMPIEKPFIFPTMSIHDFPRFEWRGMLLDCCRHFIDKNFVKRYIDLLAYHKMNVLHWHLTEDQGWRIVIDKYPKLTEIGAWRAGKDGSPYGGFYTKEDIQEVLDYAAERHITVVPEIELPGHSTAALAAYPHLSCTGGPFEVETDWGVFKDIYCAGNDSVFGFLEDVLTEVMELFPSKYIHIGGDEVPKYRWEHCIKCQNRIAAEDLHDEHELQSYFIKRIEKFLNKNGRQLIGWDEILEGGLAPSATVQSWRGMEGGIAAAKSGHDAIMSPTSHCYFDYGLDATDLQEVYSFDPIPSSLTEEEAKHILGGECNMWTERAPQETIDSKVFPRILAMSEALWSKAEKDYPNFYERVQKHYPKLEEMGVNYGYESVPITSKVEWEGDVFLFHLFAGSPDMKIEYNINEEGWLPYETPFSISESATIAAKGFKNSNNYGAFEQKVFITSSTSKTVEYKSPHHDNYPGQGKGNLTDGLIGSTDNFRDGFWQGFWGEDVEVVVDLGTEQAFSEIRTGFFQYYLSWIMLPKQVEYAISNDGENFETIYAEQNKISPQKEGTFRYDYVCNSEQTARYIRVKAENYGILPEWHPAAGSPSWIFVDEVLIQ